MINIINIIEICVPILSAAGALIIGKIHLPAKTAQEVRKILDQADQDINSIMPNSTAADLANIIDKIIDCSLSTAPAEDQQVIKQSVIEVLKALNINVDTNIFNQIDQILDKKTNKNILPLG